MNAWAIESAADHCASMAVPRRLGSTPSRHSNPFATCWTRPGKLAFRFFDDRESLDSLMHKLAERNWRGEILGGHGSGKSTLVASLTPHLEAAGRQIVAITLRDGERRLPRSFWKACETSRRGVDALNPILVIDGFEQLRWFERFRIKRYCSRTGDGLIVTSHVPTGLPSLIELNPSLAVVCGLTSVLCAHATIPISNADVASSYARYGSNVREIFFELYDCFEARCRRAEPTD